MYSMRKEGEVAEVRAPFASEVQENRFPSQCFAGVKPGW